MTDKIILLVEDNPKDAELTERALKKGNIRCEVMVIRDGAAALDYLFSRYEGGDGGVEELPHLVLLDLKLPKVDGFEVLRRIRNDARTTLVPVVILTTSDEETDRLEGYRLRANSFVQKPVDFDEFAGTVARLADYWLTINEPPQSMP